MAASLRPLPGQALRQELAGPELRATIARIVATRVPAIDVEDVMQTVLCAALAANEVPEERRRRASWVAGIARHKIADYHRAQERNDPSEPAELVVEPPAFEARDVLATVVEDVSDDQRALQTLRWIVQEHAGHRYEEIAVSEALPPATVRQRVSRLRRRLRAKWLVAALVGGLALALGLGRDTAVVDHGAMAADGRPFEGRWRVLDTEAAPEVDAKRAAAVALVAQSLEVTVRGDHATFTTATHDAAATLRRDGDALTLVSRDHGELRGVVVERTASLLVLDLHHAGWSGRVTLERR